MLCFFGVRGVGCLDWLLCVGVAEGELFTCGFCGYGGFVLFGSVAVCELLALHVCAMVAWLVVDLAVGLAR